VKFYAGIGSRETPEWVKQMMYQLGVSLAFKEWTLRTGGAEGADQAFEQGAVEAKGWPAAEVWIPWDGFNGYKVAGEGVVRVGNEADEPIAARMHPNWDACTQGARKLHTRNVAQILGGITGEYRETRSSFVVCWTKDGNATGGTGLAIRLAESIQVPVFNLFRDADRGRIERWLATEG
jgi:hypothetical protein